MKRELILYLVCFLFFTTLFGHEKHLEHLEGRPQSWVEWIGSFHLIFLHFPIALIAMTGIAELLFVWRQRPIYDSASRFMIIAAAALAIPTALLGLTYSYTATYNGLLADFIRWHMWLGIATGIVAIFVAFFRLKWGIGRLYYLCLFFLFILVNATGYLGGGMTFGPYHMYPPR